MVTQLAITSVASGFAVACVLMSVGVTELQEFLPSSTDIAWLLLSSLASISVHLLFSQALKLETAGVIALTRTFDVLMGFMMQAAVLPSEQLEWTSVVGAVLIVATVTLVAVKRL